jgi:hypothetical protein
MKSLLAFVWLVLAAPSFACEAVLNLNPSQTRMDGKNCSAWIAHSSFGQASLSEAEDVGGGFVLQSLFDVEACSGGEIDNVVQDCKSGRAAIFGEVHRALWAPETDKNGEVILTKSEILMSQIEQRAKNGNPMRVDEILSAAREVAIDYVIEAKTDSVVAINGHRFKLGCGCRTYYGN